MCGSQLLQSLLWYLEWGYPHMCHNVCVEVERQHNFENHFSSTMWDSGIELTSSDLAASISTH